MMNLDYVDLVLRVGAIGVLALLVKWGLTAFRAQSEAALAASKAQALAAAADQRAQAEAFLAAMAKRDQMFQEALHQRDSVVQTVSGECHEGQDRSTTAVIALTGAMAGVKEAVLANSGLLGEVKTMMTLANGMREAERRKPGG